MEYYEFNRLCKEPVDIKKVRKAIKNIINGAPKVNNPEEADVEDDYVLFNRALNELERYRRAEKERK
ncbi:hypothetical protein [Paenibacillus odorifer]|uniref:hypothetical protein n=1 Tax=Paenibacillus odorifer TaxID=189426 RepID=UPI00096E413D|nr:hypothetical protein [Paenibacillus odorifer]OMD75303.1 hypothetical protein BSK50_19070 [Paenibacillus odorifer]